jgi:hypothetical protein
VCVPTHGYVGGWVSVCGYHGRAGGRVCAREQQLRCAVLQVSVHGLVVVTLAKINGERRGWWRRCPLVLQDHAARCVRR